MKLTVIAMCLLWAPNCWAQTSTFKQVDHHILKPRASGCTWARVQRGRTQTLAELEVPCGAVLQVTLKPGASAALITTKNEFEGDVDVYLVTLKGRPALRRWRIGLHPGERWFATQFSASDDEPVLFAKRPFRDTLGPPDHTKTEYVALQRLSLINHTWWGREGAVLQSDEDLETDAVPRSLTQFYEQVASLRSPLQSVGDKATEQAEDSPVSAQCMQDKVTEGSLLHIAGPFVALYSTAAVEEGWASLDGKGLWCDAGHDPQPFTVPDLADLSLGESRLLQVQSDVVLRCRPNQAVQKMWSLRTGKTIGLPASYERIGLWPFDICTATLPVAPD